MKLSSLHVLLSSLAVVACSTRLAESAAISPWKVGAPVVTYWCGPSLTDAVAAQMAEGGWNLVWCSEGQLDVAQRHGLRAQLQDALLTPGALDDPKQRERLDALIERIRKHPALYSYFITDEPSAAQFAALGKLVAYLRERDPAHLAYINLFPTYASQEQLGNKGDTATAYKAHLNQYVDQVKPALISYDHYQFAVEGDRSQYFLNLALIRRASMDAQLPFLNIVQASSWAADMRVPVPEEMRYLVYTTLAYGGEGISYYIYTCANHKGGIANADGTPTELYHALKTLNREFVAIASELQPLHSLAVYHAGMTPPGAEPLPKDTIFSLEPPIESLSYKAPERVKGALLGYFGPSASKEATKSATHLLLVNLDYKVERTFGVRAAGHVETFDASTRQWSGTKSDPASLVLPGGGGKLVRLRR